jgi:hypothetical protein
MIHNALTLTAARGYRPFGEIGAACLPPVAARDGQLPLAASVAPTLVAPSLDATATQLISQYSQD